MDAAILLNLGYVSAVFGLIFFAMAFLRDDRYLLFAAMYFLIAVLLVKF